MLFGELPDEVSVGDWHSLAQRTVRAVRGGVLMRETHKYLCESGDCLSEVVLTLDSELYRRRFYFSSKLPCPVCSRDMYEVKQ